MQNEPSAFSVLDRSSREIRLLVLLQDLHADDQRIQCRLITTLIDDSPSYEALSYTWGSPGNSDDKVWVNGVLVPVRFNLLSALTAIRGHGKPDRALWVDSL